MKKVRLMIFLIFTIFFLSIIQAQNETEKTEQHLSKIDTTKISQIIEVQKNEKFNFDETNGINDSRSTLLEYYDETSQKLPKLYVDSNNTIKDKNLKQERNQNDVVKIYADHDNGFFGRSLYRTLLMSIYGELFRRTDTYYVDQEIGSYLTAVVLKSETIERLSKMMLGKQSLYLDNYEISIDSIIMNSLRPKSIQNTIYRFKNNTLQLTTSFSVEKTPKELIEIIEQFYANEPIIQKLVVEFYKDNYIIRIHSAENFLEPWNHSISINEALIMATYLGDIDQPLWGIYNGNAAISTALAILENR